MTYPNPPEHLLKLISGNPSAKDFFGSLDHVRTEVKSYLREAGFDFRNFHEILDFGCGVGRFLFAFHSEMGESQRLWGCDVNSECAKWCQENIDFAQVSNNSIDPPLLFEEQFDLVYALSVFTHLRLDMQFRWAWEIYRVLRRNGVLFATFHGPAFFPIFYEANWGGKQVKKMYSLGDGVFSYLSAEGVEKDEGQVNVAAAHTAEFLQQQMSAFELIRCFPQCRMAGGQDLYIFRKPAHGRPISRPVERGSFEQLVWVKQLSAASGNSEPLILTFHVSGHQKFRVYPSVSPDGIYLIDWRIEIEGGGRTLLNESMPLNNCRIYGSTHHTVIELSVPDYDGLVKVSLSAKLRTRGSLPTDGVADISWCFPNFT